MKQLQEYESLALFMLNRSGLPQITAVIERTILYMNINKTKMYCCKTFESIVKVSEKITTNFDIDEHHVRLQWKCY